MEDFIYILIGIAWIAFSIYGQQKKLKEKQRRAAERSGKQEESEQDTYREDEKEESFIDQIFHEFEQEEQKPEYETIYQRQRREEKAKKATKNPFEKQNLESIEQMGTAIEGNSSLSKDYFRNRRAKAKDRITNTDNPEKVQEVIDLDAENETENASTFSLRNAVIYQTILERPYD